MINETRSRPAVLDLLAGVGEEEAAVVASRYFGFPCAVASHGIYSGDGRLAPLQQELFSVYLNELTDEWIN